MKKFFGILVAVAGVVGLVAVASAHMWGGGYSGGPGYGGYGMMNGYYGMGPGMMYGNYGPGQGQGYYCNGPVGTGSVELIPQDQAQKTVETFAAKSFPGFKVGKVERDNYGRPFYTASLTGKDSRFEVQVNGFDGRIIGVFPYQQ